MKRLLLVTCTVVAMCACNHANTVANTTPPRPENALSTLTEDLTLSFGDDTSLVYADCFGDYYDIGLYMWQFYFMEFEKKEQLCIEVMVSSTELVIPTGTFAATSNIFQENGLLRGVVDEENYDAYSWYTRLATTNMEAAKAPITAGTMTIIANEDGTHTATFNLLDDAQNKVIGGCTNSIIIEDFRL
ncbi:MAG: hypothetical protein E7129_06530 [Rikenellaceae bacterium]|nr:hypothetical protein [Rikenellaceae bacterium]